MEVLLPPLWSVNESNDGNVLSQCAVAPAIATLTVKEFKKGKANGYLFDGKDVHAPILLLTNGAKPPDDIADCVLRKRGLKLDLKADKLDLLGVTWETHPKRPSLRLSSISDYDGHVAAVRQSWVGQFRYKRERPDDGTPGLRPPQIGALYAAQSHFTVHKHPATIVMPTGTGKTETMLSILIAERCNRLLVVVPTDALRTQIAQKLLTLGVLKEFGVVADGAQLPVVGVLKHGFKSSRTLSAFVRKCNVVVATMPLVTGWTGKVQKQLASHFSHLFVDEAHHLGAPRWEAFRDAFADAHIVQFTATPYRNDEKPIGGQLIFNYPLGQAQQDGYFKPITFKAVVEFDPRKRDQAIAEAAVEQLRVDEKKGHVLMARVKNVLRAEEVLSIYNAWPEFRPVQIHTGIKSARERDDIRKKILSREARIVVCVDMLGEGFDLPELKIAAFHDVRQTLPITLQLAGRFTRSRPDLGNATFIANIADVEVKEELRKLYQHDVDWNQLLPLYSDQAVADEFDLWEFLGGFKKFPKEISLQNVRPAMSAVAYKTKCNSWSPENFAAGISGCGSCDRVYSDVNPKENTLVILTTKRVSLDWAKIDDIYSWDWQLYILIWDKDEQLLFIHNSSNSGFFKDLAKAVCGDDVKPIGGPEVFRCLATVNRLRLNNVGLLEQLGRFIRFTMRAGSDVESGMTEAQKQRAVKSNVFGTGYENGARTSIGCSYKGRIWSHQTTNLRELKRWCQSVGRKLTDGSLDPDKVLEGTLRPEAVSVRPSVMPIGVDWPDVILREMSRPLSCSFNGEEAFFHELDISLNSPSETGELQVAVSTESCKAIVGLELFESDEVADYRFVSRHGTATIRRGSDSRSLQDFFSEHPPTIWFADGSSLRGHELVKRRDSPDPFAKSRIEAWDWTGIDLKKESQGIKRSADSIQYRVIQELKKKSFTVIFDDDGSGEAADVVGIIERKSSVDVEFYHCKYSSEAAPGARIGDFYEVCGQAQKGIRWMENATNLFTHLLQREPRKFRGEVGSRFEIGTSDDIWRIREKSRRTRVNLKVFVVQPGVSKAAISRSQLELLGVTENYLKETFMVAFGVVTSE